MKAQLGVAVISALLAVGLPTAAAAQTPMSGGLSGGGGKALPVASQAADPTPTTIDLQVCNRTGQNVVVAASYVEAGSNQFVNRGWYAVNDGACISVGSTDNANFYLFAENIEHTREWSGSHRLCVLHPGPYEFWSDGSNVCPAGYDTHEFDALRSDAFGVWTWTLNP